MNQIHSQLSLEPFKYDPEHVQQITYEDDATYGMPLHNVLFAGGTGRPPRRGKACCPIRFAIGCVGEFSDIQKFAEAG